MQVTQKLHIVNSSLQAINFIIENCNVVIEWE